MSALLLLLLACKGPAVDTSAGVDSEDTATPALSSLDTALNAPTYTLQLVASGEATDLVPGGAALTNPVDGFTFASMGDGSGAWYLTNTYVHPSGTWCVDGSGATCAGGVSRASGLLAPTNTIASMCLDGESGRLFLVASDAAAVEVGDVAPDGNKAITYLMVSEVLHPSGAVFSDWAFSGPCAWIDKGDSLVLTATDGRIVLLSAADAQLRESGTLPAVPNKILAFDNGARLAADEAASGLLRVLRSSDLSVVRTIDTGAPIVDWTLDAESGVAWIAHAGDVMFVDLSEADSSTWAVALSGSVSSVAVDPSTGLGLVLREEDGVWTLVALRGTQIAASVELDGTPVQVAAPSRMGDLTIIVQDESGSLRYEVYDPVPDLANYRPPVYAFLLTTIESPFDDDIDMPCEGAEINSVEREINLITYNANVLASLDIPVAVAVTYNFATVAARCDRLDIFDTLAGLGFELGVMVHNKPGYNCVAPSTSGVEADVCERDSPFACDPTISECSFPGDEDYCPLADWDCYIAYMNEHNLVTDGALPGGGQFVVGADRHNLWQWDWLRAYKEMSRADGSSGFDVALFAHAWAYTDDVSLDDSRAKNPAPWRPDHAVEAWAPNSAAQWDQDSAFSDLLYLPGMNSATLKLSEWQHSGVFMMDFLSSDGTVAYDAEDFEVLTQFLRASVNYRSVYAPNTWYFHIHDLGLINLTDASGVEGDGATLLRDWVSTVPAEFAARGELEWSTPATVRAAFPPR